MKKENLVIGVLGGMGTYATINLFKQYANVFSAEKEWERPRIIIDNRCTMPSRVRAFLYGEDVDKLIDEMSDSMKCLVKSGCNRIILACNTSHLFLPQIYNNVSELESKVLNIINNCVEQTKKDNIREIFLLGSEGTIDSEIYQKALKKIGVNCILPHKEEYEKLRLCIEAVKQNKYSKKVKDTFLNLINRYDSCILGCTELPVLYDMYMDAIKCKRIYDPVLLGLLKLRDEYRND